MTDRVQRLQQAAQARHDDTLARAQDAIARLARRGSTVTYRGIAEAAGVSRSWLYRQESLRQQIDQLRDLPASREPTMPPAERATADSLRQQIHTYRAEINRLKTENQEIREELARRLGADRAAAITAPF